MRLTSLLLTATLLLSSCTSLFIPAPVCVTRWEDEVNGTLLRQVRKDLHDAVEAGCTKLVVHLFSPGGSVIAGLEIIREMKAYKRADLVIEVHGGAVVASMATVILAHGSRSHRYIDSNALTLIHPIRSGWEGTCLAIVFDPKTEEAKIDNQIVLAMAVALWEGTGQPMPVVMSWLTCGNAIAGNGYTLVELGFADHTE